MSRATRVPFSDSWSNGHWNVAWGEGADRVAVLCVRLGKTLDECLMDSHFFATARGATPANTGCHD